jgi:hypothetical protein
MRDIVVNKVRKFPRIFEIELLTTLKTSKEEQIIDLSTSD